MAIPTNFRDAPGGRSLFVWLLCCLALAPLGGVGLAQAPVTQGQATGVAPVASAQLTAGSGAKVGQAATPAGSQAVSKRRMRQAEDAYLVGAKKLEQDDLDGAEREFTRALKLNPGNHDYAIAILLARQHRVTELVQQATKAKAAGEQARAEALLAQARAIDPKNPIVTEHSEASMKQYASVVTNPATARAQMPAGGVAIEPWKITAPVLASAVQLEPKQGVKSFHLRGTSEELLRNVTSAYGIRAVMDDSVERKGMSFDLEKVDYEQAMSVLMLMAHVFAVPVDETSVLFARDDETDRSRLQRQLEETIYLQGSTQDEINDVTRVAQNIFDVKQVRAQTGQKSIILRAPEDVLAPLNQTLQDLIDRPGEVMIEVKLYEVDKTRRTDIGASLPTAAGIYNVNEAAAQLVSANSTLVQQAIAQGLVSSSASNLTIAGELIASGLVSSSLLSSTIGVIGGGTMLTGITETGTVGFNMGLNSTDTRVLDDLQMMVGDRQDATFREGTKYPIMTSSYSTGVSSSTASALAASGATINGVSVASLLAQYTSGSSATVPQVTYEDLGITLDATPVIEKSGRINLKLALKIEALSGSTNDGNPILESRQFKSDITVGAGESALLVSDVNHSETAAMTGIPGLGELPGFQVPLTQIGEKDTSQLVVMVTPRVVQRRSDMVNGLRVKVRTQQ